MVATPNNIALNNLVFRSKAMELTDCKMKVRSS